MTCKMSVITIKEEGMETSKSYLCAITSVNVLVHCMGTDADKKECPYWNNMTEEEQ